MNIEALINDAVLMLNDPKNELAVANLLYGLDTDLIIVDGKNYTPTERIYRGLKDLGEDLVADNIVGPLYREELEILANFDPEGEE